MLIEASSQKWILIVEDEEDLRDFMNQGLTMKGYTCIECDNFTTAFTKINNKKYDLIVLDMNLVNSHGTDLASWIRKNDGHKNVDTPILVVSGALNSEVIQKLKGNVQDAMVKPFKLADFQEKVCAMAGPAPSLDGFDEPEEG